MDVAPSCSFMNWMVLTPSNSRKKDRSLGLREARKTCSHTMNYSKAGDQSDGHSSGDLSVPDPKNTRFLEV